MDTTTLLFMFGFFVLLVLIYVLYHLLSDQPQSLDERSGKMGKSLGMPKVFAPIFAKPLTRREKIGWLVVFVILALGALFTRLTGLGAGRHWP
jgi:hypothetical protein